MRWNDQYKINVDDIDAQHQEWFARVTEFRAAINQEHMVEEIARTLKFVVDYAQKHISDEEDYMRKINYPHIDQQIELHRAFLQKIVSVLKDLKNGKKIIPSQLHDFMATWIGQHILEHDMKIGEFLAEQQADKNPEERSPSKHERDPLMRKLKDLTALLNSELISQEDHEKKTTELLSQFASDVSTEPDLSVLGKFDRLKAFQDQGLISDDSMAATIVKLAENINIDQALIPHDNPKAKMHALNTLLENSLISDEQHEKQKVLILSNI